MLLDGGLGLLLVLIVGNGSSQVDRSFCRSPSSWEDTNCPHTKKQTSCIQQADRNLNSQPRPIADAILSLRSPHVDLTHERLSLRLLLPNGRFR